MASGATCLGTRLADGLGLSSTSAGGPSVGQRWVGTRSQPDHRHPTLCYCRDWATRPPPDDELERPLGLTDLINPIGLDRPTYPAYPNKHRTKVFDPENAVRPPSSRNVPRETSLRNRARWNVSRETFLRRISPPASPSPAQLSPALFPPPPLPMGLRATKAGARRGVIPQSPRINRDPTSPGRRPPVQPACPIISVSRPPCRCSDGCASVLRTVRNRMAVRESREALIPR